MINMYQIKIKINNEQDIIKLGTILATNAYPNQVIALTGDLGAGKTTLTKGIGIALGVKRVINSPTFTIMKIYDTNNLNGIEKLYHLDVYRLSSSESDFELEEYFYLNGLTVIEWALIIEDLLPENTWYIDINRIEETTRSVLIKTTSLDLIKSIEGENYEIIHR